MSRTRTYVSTAVSRVIDDSIINNIGETSIITAVLREESITDHILDGILEGTGSKVNQALHYAKNEYVYGLPQHTFINDLTARDETQVVIENNIGSDITFEYHKFGELNEIHIALAELTANYNYIEANNEIRSLSLLEGTPVHLEKINVIISNQVTDNQIDPSELDGSEFVDLTANDEVVFENDTTTRFTPWLNVLSGTSQYTSENIPNTKVVIHYGYLVNNVVIRKTFEIDISQFSNSKFYVQSKYGYLSNNQNKVSYFTYEYNSGTYSNIDNSVGVSDSTGDFLPVAFFVHNNENIADLKDTPEYETTKRLIDILGFNYDELSEQIQENPDIDLVQEAVLTFGISTTTNSALGRKYLGEFFIWLFENEGNVLNSNRVLSIEDGEFKQRIEYTNIESTLHTGLAISSPVAAKPGDVFTFSAEIDDIPVLQVFKQISENQYQELVVNDLQMAYYVDGDYVYVSADDRNDRLIIPINYDLVNNNFSVIEKDMLLAESIHLVFNSKITKKVKWYETGLFQFLLIAVAVVVTIVTAGSAAPAIQATYALYAASYGALAAAAIIAIQFIGINIAVRYGFSFVADKLGGENTFLAGVIGIGLSVFAIATNPTLAPKLMQQSLNLLEAGSAQIENEIVEFRDSNSEFVLESEAQLSQLDEARAELNLDNPLNVELLDAFRLIPEIRIGESPDSFYGRTVGSGNIGIVAYDYIENFTDITLRLPTIEETIKQFERKT